MAFYLIIFHIALPSHCACRSCGSDATFGFKHSSDSASSLRILTTHALKYQRQILLESSPGKLYKLLIPPEKAASYILSEPRPVARLRARIRLNRPSFNASLFKRRLVPTPTCPNCEAAEDIEHVLLECHAYDPARYQLVAALKSLVNPTNDTSWSLFGSIQCMRAITGEVSHVPARDRAVILSISAAFLSAIDSVRKI